MNRLRPRLVDGEAAAAQLIIIQLGDGRSRFLVCAHFHERESTRPPGGHVAHDSDRFDGPGATEELLELCFSRFVREVSDIQLPTHTLTPLPQTRQSAPFPGARLPTVPKDPWVDFVSS